jgi:hypothetical protein
VRYGTGALCDPSHPKGSPHSNVSSPARTHAGPSRSPRQGSRAGTPNHAGGRAAARIGQLTKCQHQVVMDDAGAFQTSTGALSESLMSRQEVIRIACRPRHADRSAPSPARLSPEIHVYDLSNLPRPTGAASLATSASTVRRDLQRRLAQRFPGGLLTRKGSQVQTLSRPPARGPAQRGVTVRRSSPASRSAWCLPSVPPTA